jgi:Leishmanolysin
LSLATRRLALGVAGFTQACAIAAACSSSDTTAPSHNAIGAPSAIAITSGNNQSALAGTAPIQLVTFKVTDQSGNGVPNTSVTFQVTAGEGSLAGGPASALTNQTGTVVAPSWTLGKLAIAQQLSASAGNVAVTANATVSTQYHAEARFFGPPIDTAYAIAVTRAINRLNAEVVGAMTPVTFTNQDVANTCGATGTAPLNEQIGSLVIYVSVGVIDGVGGVIASSGPCYVRQSNHLTVVGTMMLDAADLPAILRNGQLNDVVFHEMQHVLGFGTSWATVTPPLIVNAATPQTAFTGQSAIHSCQQAGGIALDCVPSIPLESGGGPGSADQHWRWSIFGNELMTAILPPPGTPKLLSAITIGSITDLGYQTNPNVADSYTIPSALAASYSSMYATQPPGPHDTRELLLKPRIAISVSGSTVVLP